MKRIFILAAAAAMTATACSDKQIAGGNQKADDVIGFRPVTHKTTRAVETTVENITDFKVYGFWDNSYNFMYGIDVVRGENNTWNYSPLRYWPSTGLVDFYAFSPAGSRGIAHSGIFPQTSTKKPQFEFRVSPINAMQEDFLVAAAPGKGKADGQVQLNFTHALSQLVFEVRNGVKDVNFEITDITLTGLNTTGTINLENLQQDGTWGDGVAAWEVHQSGIDDFVAPINAISVPYEARSDKYIRLSGPNDGLMVLPQLLARAGNGVNNNDNRIPDDYEKDDTITYLKITYGVKLSDGSAEIVPAGTEIFLSLGSVLNKGFEIGKKYIFQLNLTGSAVDLEPISFTVSNVTQWVDETVNM